LVRRKLEIATVQDESDTKNDQHVLEKIVLVTKDDDQFGLPWCQDIGFDESVGHPQFVEPNVFRRKM
jgi:hypothetical protein